MIPARAAILRNSLAMKGYGFTVALAAETAALGAGTAGAVDRGISGAVTLAAAIAGAVPCRIMALLFLL
jgi:hypothetical protein